MKAMATDALHASVNEEVRLNGEIITVTIIIIIIIMQLLKEPGRFQGRPYSLVPVGLRLINLFRRQFH